MESREAKIMVAPLELVEAVEHPSSVRCVGWRKLRQRKREMTSIIRLLPLIAVLVMLSLGTGGVLAQEVDQALSQVGSADAAARKSEAAIGEVVDEIKALKRQYGSLVKEIDGLKVYRGLLVKQVRAQEQEIRDYENSINQVSVIERQVMPLMMRMVDGLEQFVELDVPFLLEERRRRVAFLRDLLERADVTVAEKFRRVLEAFEVENDYGRTIEAYKGSLEVGGSSREVDFLRIGRVALLYLTADGEVYGMWNKAERRWEKLPARYRTEIKMGLRIASKQIAPDLLILPIPAPEAAR